MPLKSIAISTKMDVTMKRRIVQESKGGTRKWDPCTVSSNQFKLQFIHPGPYLDESFDINDDNQP